MTFGFFNMPQPGNEPVLSYTPGSKEREDLKTELEKARSSEIEIPMVIGGRNVTSGKLKDIRPPHDINRLLGTYHAGDNTHVELAIKAALATKEKWTAMSWETRASVFLKAADLLAGPYRAKMNAATMLCQSKTIHQAEIDSTCELIDFFRFNVHYMTGIYSHQPQSVKNIWNRLEWRPLEGFVFALTPFNFTSIAGNLPTAPALMGNVVVWKPSKTQVYSAAVIMEVLQAAGLPDGVINMVFSPGPVTADVVLSHPDFAGIHFTGSTEVFQNIWKTIGENISRYKSYPRIVGETGGKDFVLAHRSANPVELTTALTRGAFEYQGQKCSAASRAYIPDNLWPETKRLLTDNLKSMKIGDPEDFTCFFNAVIDEASFDKLAGVIDKAKEDKETEIVAGGTYDKSKGYFIHPTIIKTTNPRYYTMEEELFGPVLTVYVYPADDYDNTLKLVDNTSVYGLTGAVFAKDREVLDQTTTRLRYAAGNFYINDKPTGAVVGQQPFGGSRGSGTNDKAGSMINLLRWVSPRAIKENFLPPGDYGYPFMKE